MLGKLIGWGLLLSVAYWYWSGPYQQQRNPSYESRLQENTQKMEQCRQADAYRANATGEGGGNTDQRCARKHNLYRHRGQWHSYDDVRPSRYD